MPASLCHFRAISALGLLFALQAPAWASSYAQPEALIFRVTPVASASRPASPANSTPERAVEAVASSLRERGLGDATTASLAASLAASPAASFVPGARQLRLTQQLDGLEVYGSSVKSTFNARGELSHLVQRVVAVEGVERLPAQIDESAALDKALARVRPGVVASLKAGPKRGVVQSYIGDPAFHEPPEVTRVWVPQLDGRLAQGYVVQTWTRRDNQLHRTLVGGDGEVLADELRTANDRYNVFTVDPARGPQALVNGPGRGNEQSSAGWLGNGAQKTIDIAGNNVRAYLDTTSNNAPDPGGSVVGDGSFTTSADLTQAPGTAANKAVAVQNLFYLNNKIHDILYRYGFVEAAGNFQADNFARGGRGNDPVYAEAQDGGGIDNANFATPPDGTRPRMQMYLWNGAKAGSLKRDGDLDSDVVYHEYGHGLTWRMIDGMSGPIGGAVGEGASDVLSFMVNGRDVVGTYASSDPSGIRRYRYAGYPLTYADVKGAGTHDDGEVYAAAMWRLRELWLASGRSNDVLFTYFVDGMYFTPSTPTFENMRNGMLDSIKDIGGSDATASCALVWKAFAQFGIGEGATAKVSGAKVVVTPSAAARKDCEY